MKTKSLLKLSLITALIGTFFIIILADNLEPQVIQIININEKTLDQWVKVQGIVTNQRTVDSLNIFTVYDGTAGIRAVLRRKIPETAALEQKEVEIIGKVIDYKGEFEIEISKLRIIK